MKYEAQRKHMAEYYTHFNLQSRKEEFAAFRAACLSNGSTPTTELRKFMAVYTERSAANAFDNEAG
jgi:hypothetical protein